MRVEALDRLNTDNAFMFGLVRKHRRAGDVPDGVNTGDTRPVELVDDDGSSIGFYADFLKAKIFNVADNADG